MERATVGIYEQQARQWQARRPPRRPEDAAKFAAALPPGALRIDLGCGGGAHLAMLGAPAVALDAARAMLELVAERAPDAWRVQADVEALPFRRGAFAGAWSRASHHHVPRARVPLALADVHRATQLGGLFHLTVRHGDLEGSRPGDEFPGRFFAEWRPDPLRDAVTGAGFDIEREEHDTDWLRVWARRARTLPDTVGPRMRLLVCGLNPSLYAADAGVGFARPGNRFWPAAVEAGLVTRERDGWHALRHHGLGMTDLVKRATTSAAELSPSEYRAGADRVERLARWLRPGAVCFVGLAGWRAAVDRRASAGVQPGGFGGVPVYLMPSTSGLNASSRLGDLVAHLRAAADLAARDSDASATS